MLVLAFPHREKIKDTGRPGRTADHYMSSMKEDTEARFRSYISSNRRDAMKGKQGSDDSLVHCDSFYVARSKLIAQEIRIMAAYDTLVKLPYGKSSR